MTSGPQVGADAEAELQSQSLPGGDAVAELLETWLRDGAPVSVDAALAQLSDVESARLVLQIERAFISEKDMLARRRHLESIERVSGSASRSVRESAAKSLARVAVIVPWHASHVTLVRLIADRELDPGVRDRVVRSTIEVCERDLASRRRTEDLISDLAELGRLDEPALASLSASAARSGDASIREWGQSLSALARRGR